MPVRRTSDSLRAVLLSAKSQQSGSASKHGSSALTWHSLKSAGPTGISDPPGHYFPSKLALAMGLVKLFFSFLMMGLGAIAIVMNASISSIGAGVWVGVIVGVSGFLGVCAARRPYVHVYVISFMSVSILSLAASGLLVVLSTTAWARDNQAPQIILFDKETQSEVEVFGDILVRRPSILVSGLLSILGIFDLLLSLACVALSAREACGTPSAHMGVFAGHDGHDKKERLYRWLGQQKNIFQSSSTTGAKNISSVSQFVPLSSSGESSPFRKHSSSPPQSPSAEPLLAPVHKGPSKKCSSDGTAHKIGSKTSDVSKVSSGASSSKKNSSVVLIHPKVDYSLKEPFLVKRKSKDKPPPPAPQELYSMPPLTPATTKAHHQHRRHRGDGANPYGNLHYSQHPQYVRLHSQDAAYVQGSQHRMFQSLPYTQHPQQQFYAQHPNLYYAPIITNLYGLVESAASKKGRREVTKVQRRIERKKEKEKRKLREIKQKRREERQRRKDLPLTDQQIESSYTGLDREIAEGFISLAMEPAASRRRVHPASDDQDSF